MEELEELRRQLEEQRRLLEEEQRHREDAEARARSEQRLREDADARARSEQRLREDAEALARREKHSREEEQRLHEEERRLRQDAERRDLAVVAALEREREELMSARLGRPLQSYLADIHRLNFFMSRLLRPAKNPVQTLSEGNKSTSVTYGRTNINGKYYPLQMRSSPEVLAQCQAAFRRIEATLNTQTPFPSTSEMEFVTSGLREKFPIEFLDTESFRNELRTSAFLHETLQTPAQRIINEYLDSQGDGKKVFIDNLTLGWKTQMAVEGDEGTGESQGTTSTPKPPAKTRPDSLVLCADMLPLPDEVEDAENTDGNEIRSVYRVSVGEHKALHRLRSPVVARFLQQRIEEDFMVQLAKSTPGSAAQEGTGETGGGTAQEVLQTALGGDQGAAREARAPALKSLPGQAFFARALTQTFHYMVTSGIGFGYMATGETISLLQVSREDPTVLLYHTMLFPEYCRRRPNGQDVMTEVGEIDRLSVSLLCGLCLLALESTPESARRRSINISQLALFPELPPSIADASLPSSSGAGRPSRDDSQGRRRRREDDDGGDDERPGGGNGAERGRLRVPEHRPRRSSPLKRQRSASKQPNNEQDEGRRKQQRVSLQTGSRRSLMPLRPSRFDPSSFRPIRPYCTQACLRSLVREEEPDFSCPNIILHLQALRHSQLRQRGVHAITKDQFCELMQQQLLDNAEQDCDCLLDQGFSGAIGCLFKMTLTGYGYTVVAKGVQSHHRRRLRHEVDVYEQLVAQQGRLIPVCIGLIKLHLPYPMVNCTLVTHMLLMSYAGVPLYSEMHNTVLEQRGIDVEEESMRTMRELQEVGLDEHDEESSGNLTWCEETARVMKIDFDHAYIRRRTGFRDANTDVPGAARPTLQNGEGKKDGHSWDEQRPLAVESLLLA